MPISCWPHLRPYNSHKLQFRSQQCVFLGYSPFHKDYKCFHIPTCRIYISRNVVFDEHIFTFSQLGCSSPLSSPLTQDSILLSTLPQSTTSPNASSDQLMNNTMSPIQPDLFFTYSSQTQGVQLLFMNPTLQRNHLKLLLWLL